MQDITAAAPCDRRWPVTGEMTAEHHGNPGFPVLATPVVVELIEATAIALLEPYLDDGEGSVGIALELDHTAPTPVGRIVTVQARVASQEGRIVALDVDVHDDAGPVARAQHRRAVVNRQKFLDRSGITP